MKEIYHSIIGLPESGKTTFLAAFWHVIDAGELPTTLKLNKLTGNNTYLNKIVDTWRQCYKVPRTKPHDETNVSIQLRHQATDQCITLEFPDLSGESFNQQFAMRKCKTEYVENYEKDGGILLFINANRSEDGMDIVDFEPILQGVENRNETSSAEPWSPAIVPQQVRLVDLLQFIQRPPFNIRRRRLAVIVSAWDVVASTGLEPKAWLEREYPFLHQYLIANQDSFDFKVYGISAQGGDIPKSGESPTDEQTEARNKLLSKQPSERLLCMGANENQHDITAPIYWLSRMNSG